MDDPYADGGLLLDVRSPEETAQGHVPSALLVPIDELAGRTEEVKAAAGGLHVPVLVMCRLGRRAERAVGILRRAGFTRALNIGGIEVEPLRSILRTSNAQSQRWARFGLQQRALAWQRWVASVRSGRPDYSALVDAHRHAYGAEMNFRDAGIEGDASRVGWRHAEELRLRHAAQLERFLSACGGAPPLIVGT